MSDLADAVRKDNAAAPPAGTELCRLDELKDPGSKGFNWREGMALFAGFVVRQGEAVTGYVDECPHAGLPLSLGEDDYLTRDGRKIICSAHGAMFRPHDGVCVSGPGKIYPLTPWPVVVGADGVVRVA